MTSSNAVFWIRVKRAKLRKPKRGIFLLPKRTLCGTDFFCCFAREEIEVQGRSTNEVLINLLILLPFT